MQVLINTDRNIHTNAVQERRIENDLANTLEKFGATPFAVTDDS